MNEDSKKDIDADTLFAYREGLLDAEMQQRIEERLRFSREDRDLLAAFDRDLDFMKSALGSGEEHKSGPDLWAIRQEIHSGVRRKSLVRVSSSVAAAVFLVAMGLILVQNRGGKPATEQTAAALADAEYLSASVMQMEYELELLRAQIKNASSETSEKRTQMPTVYADTATILLESARYWDQAGGDPEMSKVRYAEILAHFPESAAAAMIIHEKPAALFGDKPL